MKRLMSAALLVAGLCLLLWTSSREMGIKPQTEAEKVEEIPWQMSIIEETIEVEGLPEADDILFVTDMHVIVRTQNISERVIEHAGKRRAGFLNEEGVASEIQFPDWIEYANEQEVDCFVMGGDIIDFPSDINIDYLENELGGLEMPYLMTLGNHDWTYPWEYMTKLGKDTYLPRFEELMENTAIEVNRLEGLTLVSIDNSSGQVNTQVLDTYQKLLEEQVPTLVVMHVPLVTQSALTKAKERWGDHGVVLGGGNYGGIWPDETSKRFIELTTAKDSPVIGILAGHIHVQDKDMVNEKIVQIVGGAGYEGNATLLHIEPQR